MEKDEKKQRIADAWRYIASGEFAREEKPELEEEAVDDGAYRVKQDRERSEKVLADFLVGKMFAKEEEE